MIMSRYVAALPPLIVVGAVAILALPWLGLLALLLAALAVLAGLGALAWSIVVGLQAVGRAIGRRWHERNLAPQPSSAVSLAERRRA
jgi:hypothetical protein